MSDYSYLMDIKGKELRFNKGGPNSIWGNILDVNSDYVVVQTKDAGVVYLTNRHIKSFGEPIESKGDNNAYSSAPEYMVASDFNGLFEQLKLEVVQVNLNGPEKVKGVLSDFNDDFLVMILKDEILRIPTFHITAISVLKQNQAEDQEKQNDSQEEKKSSKSKSDKKSSSKSKKK